MIRSLRLATAVACACSLVSCARPDLLVLQGNHRHEQGQYGRATISYMAALERGRNTPTILYDLAGVYYALGETEPALDALGRALEGEGRELRFRAHFNLGSAYYDLARYGEAVVQYVEALKTRPDDIDAKINLELALRKLQSSGTAAAPQAEPASGAMSASTRRILDLARQKERAVWQSLHQAEPDRREADW